MNSYSVHLFMLPILTCQQVEHTEGGNMWGEIRHRSRISVGVNLYCSFQTKASFKLIFMKSSNEIQNYIELFRVWNVLLKTQPLFC